MATRRSSRLRNSEAYYQTTVQKAGKSVKAPARIKRRLSNDSAQPRKKRLPTSDLFQPLHTAFWMKPLGPMLVELTVDSKTFNYLPEDVFVKALKLHLFQFRDPCLLFRAEYLTAYNELSTWKGPQISGAVVTGYPGIGKTYFMIFVLLRRLSEGLPTAIQYTEKTFVLFTDQGSTEHSGDSGFDFPDHSWVLTDSNAGTLIPCFAFRTSPPDVFVLQTTSPMVSRYKEWRKQRGGVKLYVMECVALSELKAIGQIRNFDIDKLAEYYEDWGPSTRTCLELARGTQSTEDIATSAAQAARRLALSERGVPTMEEYDPADATNVLFSIHPAKTSRSRMRPAIATDRIHNIVLAQVSRLDATEQSRFFGMISGHPWLRSPLGHFYEKLMHVRLTADPDAEPLPCRADGDEPPVLIPAVSNVVSVSDSTNLKDANKNTLPFYWRPVSQTFTTFDAIICTAVAIFLIQSTVSPTHDMKRQGLDFIHQNIPVKFWKSRKCYVVFVTLNESNAIRLASGNYPELNDFQEVEVLSCVFPIGTSTFTTLQLEEVQKHSVAALDDDEDDTAGSRSDDENDLLISDN